MNVVWSVKVMSDCIACDLFVRVVFDRSAVNIGWVLELPGVAVTLKPLLQVSCYKAHGH